VAGARHRSAKGSGTAVAGKPWAAAAGRSNGRSRPAGSTRRRVAFGAEALAGKQGRNTMGTELQIRANGHHRPLSTTLRTAREKPDNCSIPKSGLAALGVALFDESAQEFERFSLALIGDLGPRGAVEELLAERIAVCAWRLRRIYRIESGLFSKARVSAQNGKLRRTRDIELVFLRLTSQDDTLAKLTRYEASLERSLHQAMQELRSYQIRRAATSAARHLLLATR
jgi:hypothetical protein